MMVRMEWLEMCGETVPIHNPVSVLPLVKGVLVTDARSLFDVIQKGSRHGWLFEGEMQYFRHDERVSKTGAWSNHHTVGAQRRPNR